MPLQTKISSARKGQSFENRNLNKLIESGVVWLNTRKPTLRRVVSSLFPQSSFLSYVWIKLELVNDVLTNRINANRIDGAELQAKLAPFLQLVSSPELSKYLTPREVEDLRAVHPVVNDKLDLVAMVKAWNIVLSVLKKRILVATDAKATTTVGPSSKGQENVNPFLEMKNLVPSLPDQLERHSNHLAALRDMNQRLRELIPEIKQNTQKLREKVAPLTAKQQRDNTKTSSSGVLPSPRSTPFASSTFSSSMVTPSRPNRFVKDISL